MAKTNFYPPIMDTYLPAFLQTQKCKVYFTLSGYNKITEVGGLQVRITTQNSNTSVLSDSYATGIMLVSASDIVLDTDLNKYYIEISPKMIKNGSFTVDTYYKIQLRFVDTEANINSYLGKQNDALSITKWLNANTNHFSEWSASAFMKPISNFDIQLSGFSFSSATNKTQNIKLNQLTEISGNLKFAKGKSEYLEWYRIKIYDYTNNSQGTLVEDSGDCIPTSTNTIFYICSFDFIAGTRYQLVFEVRTNNDYEATYSSIFQIAKTQEISLNGSLYAEPEIEFGRIKITYVPNVAGDLYSRNLILRKSSNQTSKYTEDWVDVYSIASVSNDNFSDVTIDGETVKGVVWYDYICEDGLIYNYKVQLRDNNGVRTDMFPPSATDFEGETLVTSKMDDGFLCGNYRHLRIEYDPNIGSYQRKIPTSVLETLGSKYPFFKKNGSMDYHSFDISGTISYKMDHYGFDGIPNDSINRNGDPVIDGSDTTLFIENHADIIPEGYEYSLSTNLNFCAERLFREEVMDFLYNGDVKMWKSASEGNHLIVLTDVTLSPKNEIGRIVFSFSATATEIDDFSVQNCDYYHIQEIGDYPIEGEVNANYSKTIVGQIEYKGTSSSAKAPFDLIADLNEKYKYDNTPYNNIWKVGYINWIRVMRMDPDETEYIWTKDKNYLLINGDSEGKDGTKFYICDEHKIDFFDIRVYNAFVYLQTQENIIIDYQVTLVSQNAESDYQYSYTEYKVGQYIGEPFPALKSIVQLLHNKYYYKNEVSFSYFKDLYKAYFSFNNENNNALYNAIDEYNQSVSEDENAFTIDDQFYMKVLDSMDSDYELAKLWKDHRIAFDDFIDEELTILDIILLGFRIENWTDSTYKRFYSLAAANKALNSLDNGEIIAVDRLCVKGIVNNKRLFVAKNGGNGEPGPVVQKWLGSTPSEDDLDFGSYTTDVEVAASDLDYDSYTTDVIPSSADIDFENQYTYSYYQIENVYKSTVSGKEGLGYYNATSQEDTLAKIYLDETIDYANGVYYLNYINNEGPELYIYLGGNLYRIIEYNGHYYIAASLYGVLDYYYSRERGVY